MIINSEDFMEMTINEESDLLLSNIGDDKSSASALLCGCDDNGQDYNLIIKLEKKEKYAGV